ncbi:hypothetical protein F4779DRAFT_628639 [Xylariaceae sp. FL0662B]|nr:hypothetical protein F4779DRAFT_628639 [Xylariaceae sp. FL0662B]
MATFTLKPSGIPVRLPNGLSEHMLLSFEPFNNWLKTLTASLALQHTNSAHPFHSDPYTLCSITVQSYDLFWGGRLGFLKLLADVANAAGECLNGSVFLRGPSVAMLIMLIPDDDAPAGAGAGASTSNENDERYAILTVQPRIPAGSLAFAELPAGMVDDDAGGTFAGTAAREIWEELGLVIPAAELRNLSEMAAAANKDEGRGGGEKGEEGRGIGRGWEAEEEGLLPPAVYPSPGGCDEHIPIFIHERRVPRAQLREWTGRLTGLRDHGEKITLKLVAMRDLWREGARDAKCLAALALWEGLRREGKL